MNFVHFPFGRVPGSKTRTALCLWLGLLSPLYFVGCSDEVHLPSAEQLRYFENAGPQPPKVDMERLVSAKIGGGPHRVLPGEVLEFTMPTILQIVTAEEPEISGKVAPYICRVGHAGAITLPVVGEIKAEGKTLAEVESAVVNAYYPQYTLTRPSVFARVLEYRTADVSISGAVNKPGIYSLNSDRMSLVALLMEAEGIIDEGAAFIRIIHAEQGGPDDGRVRVSRIGQSAVQSAQLNEVEVSKPLVRHADFSQTDVELKFRPPTASDTRGALTVTSGQRILLAEQVDISSESERRALLGRLVQREPRVPIAVVNQRLCALAEQVKSAKHQEPKSLVLPVKGLNIPFADVALQDGDRVIVERLREPMITVVGLVNKAGNFPYPPDVEYNLMQAVGFAGGLSLTADPRYATVYRLMADGKTVSATFYIAGTAKSQDPTDALSVPLKPYDVVAVEHTPRTRATVFWDRVFRVYISTFVTPDDIFGGD